MAERIYFDSVKERYDTFFVEYSPPITGFPFATLNATYPKAVDVNDVVVQLEQQAKKWVDKYPVPVVVSAFDSRGDLINLDKAKGSSHLTVLKRNGEYEFHWNLLKDSEFPKDALDTTFLLSIYTGIGYRTQSEVTEVTYKNAKLMRRFKILLIMWAVFVPAVIAILEFFSPTWVAVIALAYSLWKAYQQWLLMTGKKKSEKDIEKEKEELRMQHHHYHCEQNPDAFTRLKLENFNRDAEEKVKDEFNSIPKSN